MYSIYELQEYKLEKKKNPSLICRLYDIILEGENIKILKNIIFAFLILVYNRKFLWSCAFAFIDQPFRM